MRLLHAATIKVVEFMGTPPPYAILSHMWEAEEVTLQDLERQDGRALRKKGHFKIQKSCQLAVKRGYDYIWVDTCCIDKTSSAELSEAINSMFGWYNEAETCFALLSDVNRHDLTDIEKSRWFTRGWTLQELIAPQDVEFYNSSWCLIGSRNQNRLSFESTLGIPLSVLSGEGFSNICLGERMRWASKRTTTRPEDMAYCLLGIFDVNMPLLYGEGKRKAFRRLQEEIIRSSNDLSIFLWTVPHNPYMDDSKRCSGLFADDPDCFARMDTLTKDVVDMEPLQDTAIDINNKGVGMQLALYPVPGDDSKTTFFAMLAKFGAISYGIMVQRDHEQGTQFLRLFPEELVRIDTTVQPWKAMSNELFGLEPRWILFAMQSIPQLVRVRIRQTVDTARQTAVLPQGFTMCRSAFTNLTAGTPSVGSVNIKNISHRFHPHGKVGADDERWYARIPPPYGPSRKALAGFAVSFTETITKQERKVWAVVGTEPSIFQSKLRMAGGPIAAKVAGVKVRLWLTLVAGEKDFLEAMKRAESLGSWEEKQEIRLSRGDQPLVLRCKLEKILTVSGLWYDIKLEERKPCQHACSDT